MKLIIKNSLKYIIGKKEGIINQHLSKRKLRISKLKDSVYAHVD